VHPNQGVPDVDARHRRHRFHHHGLTETVHRSGGKGAAGIPDRPHAYLRQAVFTQRRSLNHQSAV
jgi:hypothetical protein